jgi:type VI protein secretion system component VasF
MMYVNWQLPTAAMTSMTEGLPVWLRLLLAGLAAAVLMLLWSLLTGRRKGPKPPRHD